jgi:hypothetical protein
VNDSSKDIIAHLHKVNARRNLAEKMGLLPLIHDVQDWQCKRLLATHDEMARKPTYRLAMAFFVDELYGPKDFSQRDADLARVIPKLAKVLPNKAMKAIDDALALNALSFDLDMAMAQELQRQAEGKVNRDTYALAYRTTGRDHDRQRQITIVSHLGQQLADVVHIRGISILIKLARKPAKMAGLLSLHEFLQRGYDAFKGLGDVTQFIEPVVSKEIELNQQLLDPNINLSHENPLPYV